MTDIELLRESGHSIEGATGGPCEKCYADAEMRARRDHSKSVEEHYEDIVIEAEEKADD